MLFLQSFKQQIVSNLVIAAAVMYEQAFRLSQHDTIEALMNQVKCYLATVNAFNLCDPLFAWVLIPIDPNTPPREIVLPRKIGTATVSTLI